MFLGHYGVALAAKRAAPSTSLGALTFSAQFLDELWPILLLIGLEQVKIVPGLMAASPLDFVYYPISHSLVMAITWGILVGASYFALVRYAPGAWMMAALVVSHWFLDVPMHGPDLPLFGANGPKVGWGLWNSVPATFAIEFGIFAIGVAIYVRGTRALDRIGNWGLWAYTVVLAVAYVASSSAPPPNERALAWSALGIWLFVPWSHWVDTHRMPITVMDVIRKRQPSKRRRS